MTSINVGRTEDFLQSIINDHFENYALILRPDQYSKPTLEMMTGEVRILEKLTELDNIQQATLNEGRWGTLLVVPYRQIEERGYTAINDGAPLLALEITQHDRLPLEAALDKLPDVAIQLRHSSFQQDDNTYEKTVKEIIQREIGLGEGANFVIKRTLSGEFACYDNHTGLTIFRNLLRQESGAYWTFLIRINGFTLVGASPEMHITLNANIVAMTPISGTYRFPDSGPTQLGMLAFLEDSKETYELSMVLDEELKMMTNICDSGVQVNGPFLIEMSCLAHVGYRLEGSTKLQVSQILIRSMFAPTVTGSPLENATRVIALYEKSGRSYYSGFAALIENRENSQFIDSAILIRTAEISTDGKLNVGAGATLVRDSNPALETKETAAKVRAIQKAMGVGSEEKALDYQSIAQSLSKRNQTLSGFWMDRNFLTYKPRIALGNQTSIVILDNEDAFTSMMQYQLQALDFAVTVMPSSNDSTIDKNQILIIGPGPGNPNNTTDPRVVASRKAIISAVKSNRPFVAICFGHQVLSSTLGLPLHRLETPNQGLQKKISIFGREETVAFYNTFTAVSKSDVLETAFGSVRVYRDHVTGHVYGLSGANFCSMQFHPESVLTVDGARILSEAVLSVRAKCV